MALTITNWAFDQPVYTSGQMITLTINYTSTDFTGGGEPVSSTVTVTVTDEAGDATQTSDDSGNFPGFSVNGSVVVVDPTTAEVTDDRTPPGTWTEVSNVLTGDASPYTGVAVFTTTA